MNELVAFLLPPAVGLAGMRLIRLLLGADFQARYGTGLRFAVGLGTGMLVFSQLFLLGVLVGVQLARVLSWIILLWGAIELFVSTRQGYRQVRRIRFQRAHLWLLLLLPLVYYFWVFGRISVVEGAMEFDGVSHWLIKSKMMYYKVGTDFSPLTHNPQLAYVHWDYPLLVPALYTLNYGAVGGVNEFIVKVWPCWMMFALCLAVLSLGDIWRRPHPLPLATVLVICLLPASMYYIHREGGTMAMVFYASLSGLMIVQALTRNDTSAFAAAVILLAGATMSKFEGAIFAGFWCCILLPACWRRHWLVIPPVWRAAVFAGLCLLPYVAFRSSQPVLHPESGWVKVALHSPGPALEKFPTILGIGLERRFFHKDFANWTATPEGQLHWAGEWQGWDTLTNYHLNLLPWLILLLLGIGLWQKRHWRTLLALTGVVLAVFAVLAFVIACLPQLFPQGTDASYIIGKTGDDMSRYYYPFFVAWFLGLVFPWFGEPLGGRIQVVKAPAKTA